MINKFAGKCTECGTNVPAGDGVASKGANGKWAVKHEAGSCLTGAAKPSATAGHLPTAEQTVAVEMFKTGKNLAIEAGAGAGKTSTLVLLADEAALEGRQGLFLAFNKAIVVDAGAKLPGNVTAQTAHALAYRAHGWQFRGRINQDRIKSQEIARILGIDSFTIKAGQGTKTLAAGYLAGLVMATVSHFCTKTADLDLSERHVPYIEGIDEPTGAGDRTWANNRQVRAYVMPFVRAAWADLARTDKQGGGRLNYDMAVYLKQYQLADPKLDADFILFDEAQDANPVMLAIVMGQVEHCQLVFVGDSQQAINEWMGAVNALADIRKMDGNVCYLTQSFRFGQAIADVANGLLVRLAAEMTLTGFSAVPSIVGPVAEPTCTLTRTNAEAIRQLMRAIAAGRRPYLVGGGKEIKDFAESAKALQTGRRATHHDLACFDNWTEVQMYVEQDEQGGDLRQMVKLVDDFGAEAVLAAVAGVVSEGSADVVISTAHKAKGREWDSVSLAGDFFKPRPGEGGLPVAEMRLLYVAVTRAKLELDVTLTPQVFPGMAVQVSGADTPAAAAVIADDPEVPLDAAAALHRAETLLGADRAI